MPLACCPGHPEVSKSYMDMASNTLNVYIYIYIYISSSCTCDS